MNVTVLSGVISETIHVDPGDVVFVPEGQVLSVAEGVEPFELTRTNPDSDQTGDITTIVAGSVVAGGHGFYTDQPGPSDALRYLVTETGAVTGQWCFFLHGGSGNLFENYGTVEAVASDDSGIAIGVLSQADGTRIYNHGLMLGETGIAMRHSSGQTARNFGDMQVNYCFDFLQAMDSSAFNFAPITGAKLFAYVANSTGVTVANADWVTSTDGVQVIDSRMVFENTGSLMCEDRGIELLYGSVVELFNSGQMSASELIYGYSYTGNVSSFTLTNLGSMSGDIVMDSADVPPEVDDAGDQITNGGLIDGAIRLDIGDDTYLGRGTGQTTGTVDGGAGADLLIGARLSDWFEGGADDDTLRGRRGADELSGGDGMDLLHGGRDADVLTGGAGADVFVFGATAGADVITDFELGVDMIRLHNSGGFEALQITDSGADLTVAHDGGTIVLSGMAGQTLAPEAFEFM